ncbi:glycosyltransferase family 2 protein [Paenisporosarcina macmurdoensis]|uniref:Glycosyltransferase family 2 protein n=1 Tax=Paenisporosarcina macmurdoensis TaxID=212659 RepID=A0ABW1L981_9BACL
MHPKITIGIPFYDNEKTLEIAIKSVLTQTYQNWELLLVNDGSKDKSIDIAKKFDDPRIKLLNDGENKGLIYRLNEMIDITKTDYFFRMDSDDIMHPQRIEKQLNFLLENTSIDIVGSSAIIIDEDNQVYGSRFVNNDINNKRLTLYFGKFIHPTIAGKTDWFKKHKYDPLFYRSEDHELWVRTIEESNFYNIKEPLLFYRVPKVININNYINSIKTNRKIYRKYEANIFHKLILLTKSILKEKLIFTINYVNLDEIWISRSNSTTNLDEKKQKKYQNIITKIKHY